MKLSKQRRQRLNCLRRLLQGQDGRCFYCGRELDEGDACIDHFLPRSAGGGRADNLVACCRPINHLFGAAPPWLKFLVMADVNFIRSVSRWCLSLSQNGTSPVTRSVCPTRWNNGHADASGTGRVL